MKKTVLVTGATSDIGSAICLRLVQDGFSVIATGRNEQRLSALEKRLEHHCKTISVDLGFHDGQERLVQFVKKNTEDLVGIVHAAGVWHENENLLYGPRLDEIGWEEISTVMGVTFTAALYLAHGLANSLAKSSNASFVAITGTFSAGASKWCHYYLGKQCLEVLIKALSDDFKDLGIRVNAISPADVNTAPMRGFFPDDAATGLEPDDIADLTSFFLSERSKHISGQTVTVRKR